MTWFLRFWPPFQAWFPPLHERPMLIYALAALLLGAQMMSIGFIAELITAYQVGDEHSYSIAEETPRLASPRGDNIPAHDRLPAAPGP